MLEKKPLALNKIFFENFLLWVKYFFIHFFCYYLISNFFFKFLSLQTMQSVFLSYANVLV